MAISIFDLYTIGIGPSSSHTVGPMRAAKLFLEELSQKKVLKNTTRVQVELFGSLGLTGKGHGSDKAILMGLEGETPEKIKPDLISKRLDIIRNNQSLHLAKQLPVSFHEKKDLIFHRNKKLPLHSNGMRFTAFHNDKELIQKVYYSVGGGFVMQEGPDGELTLSKADMKIPNPFQTAEDLLTLCEQKNKKIWEVILENEKMWRKENEIKKRVLEIWQAMQDCVQCGTSNEGELPGGLQVKRRAPQLYKKLTQNMERSLNDPLSILDWVNLYALAVNEENAAGGRVVTAPTNGAAGIIPAVLHYYERFTQNVTEDKIIEFLLTAGAIGILFKQNASISGAEVGCQGEVGVACSMAAAGLTAVRGGSNKQIENAAEIGMEHNLGLTCDPIGGLVQIPCIERNAMGAMKAINASRIALSGDGTHKVSLDKVMKTMMQTGKDMQSKYKETSRGGLAINIVEC